MASANGWGRPVKDTLFGPLRSWKYPINFRSIKVKNAIDTSTRTNDIVKDIMNGIGIIKR